MVEDDIVGNALVAIDDYSFFCSHVAGTNTEMSDDDIMSIDDLEAIFFQKDATAGCGLAGNRQIGLIFSLNDKITLQFNRSTDTKYNYTRTAGCHRGSETTWAGIIKIRHFDDTTAPTTDGQGTIAFGTGEGWYRRGRR